MVRDSPFKTETSYKGAIIKLLGKGIKDGEISQ